MKKIILKNEPDFTAKLKSFSYQEEAVEFVKDLKYAAIFHEQGLGKTKIALDIALYWLAEKEIDTVLVVTKKGLIKNWQKETNIHSYLNPKVLTNNKNSNFYVFNSASRLIVTNFETISTEKKRFKLFLKARNVGIIIDESAKIKNPNSKLSKDFFELSELFLRKIIMTGTPVANRPYDIWSQIFFLDQGVSLGTNFNSFKKLANIPRSRIQNDLEIRNFESFISSVYDKIKDFAIRETKKSAKLTLPEKKYINIWTMFSLEQQEIYETLRKKLELEIIKDGKKTIDNSAVVLKRILRLVQVTSNPKMLNENFNEISGKEKELMSLIKEIAGKNEKVIVWTNFLFNVQYLYEKLEKYEPVTISGSLSEDERNNSVEKFKYGNSTVLIATPQSAKEGLTLTEANNVIFYDRTFSLDDYLQAQDRIHRISQTKDCNIYNIMIRGSIDEWIHKLLLSKEKAAALTQTDINLDEYEVIKDYSFDEIIKKILKSED